MELEKEERNSIIEIMCNYKNIHEELDIHSIRLNNLSNGAKTIDYINFLGNGIMELIKRLEVERSREKSIMSILEKKYGKGTIDVNTFEYKCVV